MDIRTRTAIHSLSFCVILTGSSGNGISFRGILPVGCVVVLGLSKVYHHDIKILKIAK